MQLDLLAGDSAPFQEQPPYNPTGDAATDILGLLAWGMSAAGVAGLLLTGTQMAIQLNRGTAGENSEYFRSIMFVFFACLIGASAGPIVEYFGDLGL
ncbi:hypothetical protein GCM10012279_36120 [Micromonospora yangpuensis]|nr:hypothetical protein GCM10012279_36120 [Micromonospora yangpuensis]